MSPSVANIVVQIAAEARAGNGHNRASEKRVIERLKGLGFQDGDIRTVLNNAESLGIVRKDSQELEIVGTE